jgi:hypothetical protein
LLTKVTLLPGHIVLVLLMLGNTASNAQQTTLSPGLTRLAGTEESSHIEYVRLFLEGTLLSPATAASTPAPVPVLTAQCTRRPSVKLVFELFANFGGVDDLAFYPPWKPTSNTDVFPPHTDRFKITMEFLGYTHVKPVKREWEAVLQPAGQYRYNPPSSASSNLEDATYYLRFLLALPTLHLTLADKSAEFHTTPLLDQIRKEPLCKASGL